MKIESESLLTIKKRVLFLDHLWPNQSWSLPAGTRDHHGSFPDGVPSRSTRWMDSILKELAPAETYFLSSSHQSKVNLKAGPESDPQSYNPANHCIFLLPSTTQESSVLYSSLPLPSCKSFSESGCEIQASDKQKRARKASKSDIFSRLR